MENSNLNAEISELLERVVKDKIENYSITLNEHNKKREGYLSDLLILTLRNLQTSKETHVVIKQANSTGQLVNESFKTEIYFYKTILPKFMEIKKVFAPNLNELNIAPECLETNLETATKRIVLENLMFKKFELMDRTKSFDKNHLELLLKSYAKFHALSFAMKEKHPGANSELLKPFIEQTESFQKLFFVPTIVNKALKQVMHNCKEDCKPPLVEKLCEYIANTEKIFFESSKYLGEHSVVIHGDSWSNNMMFKYNEDKKPTDIRLIDFQLSRVASPVHDLSYSIYAGASKEILNNLDEYLQQYHNTLSSVLREFDCEVDLLYPFDILKEEWRRHSRYGFMLALMVWNAKLLMSGSLSIDDIEKGTGSSTFQVDKEAYNKISRILTLHMYENDYL